MKKQSFITGAVLLAVATALGKIFSAIFKIPLDRMFLHADGMAVFNGAYNIYMFFFAVATAGIPLAISQLIASSSSKEEEESVVSTSFFFTTSLLSLSGALIFVFADFIASLTGIEESASALRVMAPALIFCGATATLRGYFQGKRNMTPSALSQVADSLGRLTLGFALAFAFLSFPIGIISAGAISGVPFGAFLSALILTVFAKKSFLHIKPRFSSSHLKRLLYFAIPITITASLHPIFNMADTITVVPMLKSISWATPHHSFGCLSRGAMLYALPVSIATAVATSVLPAIAESAKKGDTLSLNRDSSMAMRLALAISIPCSAGFMAIPEDILQFLFENSADYQTLIYIALSATLLSTGEVTACILQGMGRVKATVVCALLSIGAKFVFNIVLIKFLGINGAAISTSLAYFVFLITLMLALRRYTTIKLTASSHLVKPVFCGALCFMAAYIASFFMPAFFSILTAASVYIPAVFLTKFIDFDELNQIFSGHKIEYSNR